MPLSLVPYIYKLFTCTKKRAVQLNSAQLLLLILYLTYRLQRISSDEAVWGYILVYNRTSANNRVVSNRYTWKNRCVCPHHHMGPNMNITKPVFLGQIFMSQNRRVIPDNRITANMYLLWKNTSTITIKANAVCSPPSSQGYGGRSSFSSVAKASTA